MNIRRRNPMHMLFLFSDTGGGHRSAAEAIIEALDLGYGETVTTEMVDIFTDYAPLPLNRVPELYPSMVRIPRAWGLGYRLSNGPRRARLILESAWPYIRHAIRELVSQHPCDLLVSVHPLAVAPILRALGNQRPPFVTVVTDLVSTHAFWYHRQSDLCLVPTEAARQRAIQSGLNPDLVQVVGLPVADRFCRPAADKITLRKHYGWPIDRPLVILVGGGEGMGPLEKTATAISEAGLNISLVVITGRNKSLLARLKDQKWKIPTFIYGFVREMPDYMQAADILVTKAGPGTISEALNAGLPLVLYSRLPGQEDGNISFVTSEGAGVWAPNPDEIVKAINHWVRSPELHKQAVAACKRLARPQSARMVADILVELAKSQIN